jgi:tetratricopeptide (TPR) repeat protein
MSTKTIDYLAREGDVVELTADLLTEGLAAGGRGVVVEAYTEPSEAYDVAFEDENGEFLGLADSLRPAQIRNVSRPILERGIELLQKGMIAPAEREFRLAARYNPRYLHELNNLTLHFAPMKEWNHAASWLQMLLRVAPDFQIARDNLAIAYENWAIAEARTSETTKALELLFLALGVRPSPEVAERVRQDISDVYTEIGKRAYSGVLPDQEATEGEGDEQKLTYGLFCMNVANAFWTTDTTVGNLSIAYARLGLYYLNRSDLESSLHMFEMMDQTGVQHPEFLNEYGVALGMCGRLEEARNVFERALELLPGDPTIMGNLRNATNETVPDLKMLQPLIEFTAPFFQQDSYPPHIAA